MSLFKRSEYLPATVLCRSPFVFGCFFEDFIKRIKGFEIWYAANAAKHKSIYAFFMFGYHYETAARMEHAKECIRQARLAAPDLRMVFLCNSEIERKNFEDIGERAVYCNQNAFLREGRYKVTNQKKIYDALYLARITPIKRHKLALKIPHLLLIGDYFEREGVYARGVLDARRPDSTWIRKVRGIFVYRYMNRAKCGLALSPEEGAMYACAEYGLCGLPVVTTKCLGGRENSLSPDFTFFVPQDEPCDEDVAATVAKVVSKNFDPHEIRQATIDVFKEHRARYEKLVAQIFDETKEGTVKDFKKCVDFPHKFGVRCRVLPFFKMFNALKLDV